MYEVILHDLNDTAKVAHSLSKIIKTSDFLALRGDLGAGKTCFAKYLINQLQSIPFDEIPSPTFTLVQIYDGTPNIWHFDLYRLKSADEVFELGFEDALYQGVSLVEWPDRIEKLLPRDRLELEFTFVDAPKNIRKITIKAIGNNWQTRLNNFDNK